MGISAMLLGAVIAANGPVPVEIWKAGDTGDVNRLAEAVERAFRSSSRFSLSAGQKPGTLYVTVLQDAKSRPVGTRMAITVSIRIADAPPPAPKEFVGAVDCWDDDMTACGTGAVALAAQRISP